MQKEIINVMKLKYTALFLFVILISSCSKQGESNKVTFLLDSQNSSYTDERFLKDSICIVYKDSIKMFFYEGDYTNESVYFEKDNNLYELRERFSEIPDESFGVDTILTFSKKDTSFMYKSAFEYVPTIFYYSLADNKYNIFKDGGMYVTVKQSLVDSTYTEKFYYDENFKIIKFVYTYQDNICTYIPK